MGGEGRGGEEVGEVIRSFKKYLPGCVKVVILRGDGEFISWEGVDAAEEEGYQYIFGNKGCNPPFDPLKWYKIGENDRVEYNECIYQPMGWKRACRFVAMRIQEDKPTEGKAVQGKLFDGEKYTYREFVTNRKGKAHKVIDNTIQIARLKLLFIAAKITGHSNTYDMSKKRCF